MANIIESADEKERQYHAGPFPSDINSRWKYEPWYLGLHGWTKCHRRAMYRQEAWGCWNIVQS